MAAQTLDITEHSELMYTFEMQEIESKKKIRFFPLKHVHLEIKFGDFYQFQFKAFLNAYLNSSYFRTNATV